MSEGSSTPDDDETPEDKSSGAAKPKRQRKKRPFWIELPILLVVALVLTIIIQSFIARVFVIPSESMEQTLHGCPGCYGDRVVVDKLVYTFGDPEPGEVVVFSRPDTWNRSESIAPRSDNGFVRWMQGVGAKFGFAAPDEDDVVKRIVAVGGQTVECCDDDNRVLVDGKPLDEPYIYLDPERNQQQDEFKAVSVPPGKLFVMGDNRNNSADSRVQGGGGQNGLVPVDNVIGKVRAIILPPSRWQGVGDHNPQALSAPAWQAALPAGVGLAAAWPTLWLLRRSRELLPIRRGKR
ncbi:signal peptidase I [Actinokineospora diospyrosa]|uniref:Signal peptidase I n=1 Tax=Actinokineospora diospyrosa TaxID=103728 RepID=A0ABT1IMC4_9PSEU|nr:signal peptidase I [Actinokineospora diospyrosa]MCP2273803.1 signal peptidase I (EC:3.4.21.89), Serine peptidase, MEROPS family S26A [Actinokineospora diospyrosa]